MSAISGRAPESGGHDDFLIGPAHRGREDDRGVGRAKTAQQLQNLAELPRSRLRDRVVESHREIGHRGRAHPSEHGLPGFQIVRERDGAKVVAQRRAGPRRRRDHRRHSGDDRDFHIRRAFCLERLEQGCRHPEHARIARGYDGNGFAACRKPQGTMCSLEFLPVVAGVNGLAVAHGYPRQIGPVADQVPRLAQRVVRRRRAVTRVPRTQPHDVDAPAHDAALAVGTSTSEK